MYILHITYEYICLYNQGLESLNLIRLKLIIACFLASIFDNSQHIRISIKTNFIGHEAEQRTRPYIPLVRSTIIWTSSTEVTVADKATVGLAPDGGVGLLDNAR